MKLSIYRINSHMKIIQVLHKVSANQTSRWNKNFTESSIQNKLQIYVQQKPGSRNNKLYLLLSWQNAYKQNPHMRLLYISLLLPCAITWQPSLLLLQPHASSQQLYHCHGNTCILAEKPTANDVRNPICLCECEFCNESGWGLNTPG